ncbi:MAG: helix-turn-helix transcriptional regulator [Robiginitomaculum sp.]|nr:helix-turn-helix transcriptional regulator [Robiginitomaculum sp.]
MGVKITKNMNPEQVQLIYQYLQREPALRDYVRLYPDYERRFPMLLSALPESFLNAILAALDKIEVPENDQLKLMEQFDLTKAESQLALLLLAGHSPVNIADLRQVSRNTVRNQLQIIYDKTSTNKLPALIRRLHDVLSAK